MEKSNYFVHRPIYSYEELANAYSEEKTRFSILQSLKSKVRCQKPSMKSILKNIIPFPFIMTSFYSYRFLVFDLIAGFTMLIFHIPQGMAYGLLAGLQPINGLYASFIPPLIYLLFGTSRHLSIGTFSIIAILASVPVYREATLEVITNGHDIVNGSSSKVINDPLFESTKLKISVTTTMLAGLFQLIMGFCKFGRLMNYVSDAMIAGFTSATAFHVLASQLGEILGYSVPRYTGVGELPYKLFLFGMKINHIHWITIGISATCIIILFLFSELINPLFLKKFKFPIPIQFVLVVVATGVSYYFRISQRLSVKIVGPIPSGLPALLIPDVTLMPRVVLDALVLALVAFVINSALVKIYALEFNYNVDFNQELVSYGLTNVFSSFFQCMMSAGSLARSAVVVQVGMKSQVATIFSCIFMVFVLLFINPLFQYVPSCVLSAIIIVSLKTMIMKITAIPSLYRLSKFDFNVWIFTFLSTIFLNVPIGLTCGFVFSLLTIVIRMQNPKSHLLGQLPNSDIYKDIRSFRCAQEIPKVKIFRFEAPLYFANAEHFKMKLIKKTNIPLFESNKQLEQSDRIVSLTETMDTSAKGDIKNTNKIYQDSNDNITSINVDITQPQSCVKFVIIDFSSINYIDNVAIRVLNDIYSVFRNLGIAMLIAAPNNNTRHMLKKSKFAADDLNKIMFVSIHDAVLYTMINGDVIE